MLLGNSIWGSTPTVTVTRELYSELQLPLTKPTREQIYRQANKLTGHFMREFCDDETEKLNIWFRMNSPPVEKKLGVWRGEFFILMK